MTPPDGLEVLPVEGIAEVTEETDLSALVGASARLADGDIVLITSKVVSKAEGRVLALEKEAAVEAETVRVVARRGHTAIVENRLGLVMAAAGVDASNVAPGRVVLLPRDPDRTARQVREQLLEATGHNVAVLVTDTAGRAWRHGQTDIAIGVAGMEPLTSLAGSVDGYGNPLVVTAPAVADELAGAAELVAGKLGGRPVVLVRGLADRVLAPGEHGPGARALVRERAHDMFGLGSREAVLAATRGSDPTAFGEPVSAAELVTVLASCGWPAREAGDEVLVEQAGQDGAVQLALAGVVAFAHGWQVTEERQDLAGCPHPGRLLLRRRPQVHGAEPRPPRESPTVGG